MKNGFYTALGTPLDSQDNLCAKSFAKQVEDQVTAGASGVLVMGSMGMGPYVRDSEFAKVAKVGLRSGERRMRCFCRRYGQFRHTCFGKN